MNVMASHLDGVATLVVAECLKAFSHGGLHTCGHLLEGAPLIDDQLGIELYFFLIASPTVGLLLTGRRLAMALFPLLVALFQEPEV